MPKQVEAENKCNDGYFDAEIMEAFEALNLIIESFELDDFVHAYDENNKAFAAAVLEYVEELL